MDLIIDAIQTLSCLYILVTGVLCLNRMTCQTPILIRSTFVLLVTGALCDLLLIWQVGGWKTRAALGVDIYDVFDTIWALSIALYVGVSQCRRKQHKLDPRCERRQ